MPKQNWPFITKEPARGKKETQKENEGKEPSVKKENNHGYPWLGLGFAEKESDR